MKTRICATAVLLLVTAACATTTPRSQFDDIPLPTGLTYQPERSVVIESPSVKAAQLVYRGRLEPASLGDVMRTRLESNGWHPVSRTTTATDGTWQVYERDAPACDRRHEGWRPADGNAGCVDRPTGNARDRDDLGSADPKWRRDLHSAREGLLHQSLLLVSRSFR